jgi:FkbM family methyltransferase
MNGKTALKRFFRAPFRALGVDLVRWRHPNPQAVISTKEVEMMAAFAPKYKPEDHWIVKAGIKTILDVGAHTGEFAQRIRAILPDADLVCFEPLREPFLALSQRFAGQPNFLAVQCALGEKAAQCEIHHNEYAASSSLLPMTELHKRSFTFAVEEKTEIIEVRRLSDVVRELNLRDPLLLKLDVQGFEDKVIIGGEDVVARAKMIIIEVSFLPLYEGGPLFDDVYKILKTRGLTYNGNFDQLLSPEDGRPLQADAIFCRA